MGQFIPAKAILKEIWENIIKYEEQYQVSSFGRVKSLDRIDCNGRKRKGRILKPGKFGAGYYYVGLYKNGTREHFSVARLVSKAFIKNPENKKEVNHKSGIKTDNTVSNLEWCDRSENMKHAFRTGLVHNKGIENPKSKLTEKDVLFIRKKRNEGLTLRKIANMFNVGKTAIHKIVNYKTWRHL